MRHLLLIVALLLPGAVRADEIRVVSSGGFAAAFRELAPQFEKATGHTVVAAWGPSMGETVDAVPQRIKRGEVIDVVIMVGYALGKMVDAGQATDRVDLANSLIGAVVRAGAPVPDISTVDKLRAALLAAPSVAYSDSASGVYIEREMFKTLGIEAEMRGRARMIPAEPVAGVVARGDAALGFQQISELKPVPGVTMVGPLPDGVQQVTVFSGGLLANAPHKEAARALLRFLSGPGAADAVRRSGMEPVAAANPSHGG